MMPTLPPISLYKQQKQHIDSAHSTVAAELFSNYKMVIFDPIFLSIILTVII